MILIAASIFYGLLLIAGLIEAVIIVLVVRREVKEISKQNPPVYWRVALVIPALLGVIAFASYGLHCCYCVWMG